MKRCADRQDTPDSRVVEGNQLVIGQRVYAPYDGVFYSAIISLFPSDPGKLKAGLRSILLVFSIPILSNTAMMCANINTNIH